MTGTYDRNSLIHELFFEQAAATPHAIAVEEGSHRLTYAELATEAHRLSALVQQYGAASGQLVAISDSRSIASIAALIGVLKSGAAYLPIDPAWPCARLQAVVDDAKPCCILSNSPLPVQGPPVVSLTQSSQAVAPSHQLHSLVDATDPAYVMYTSGSTGVPKGVCIPHRGVVRLVRDTNFASFDSAETFLHLAPLAFDASTFEIWGALLNGARLVILPTRNPSLEQISEVIQRHKVTTAWLPSVVFRQMADYHLEGFRGLRAVVNGGDVASPAHWERVIRRFPGMELVHVYGPTETTTFATFHCVRSPGDATGASIPIGKSISHSTAYIITESGSTALPGEEGELYLGGDGLAIGYLNQPALTAMVFVSGDSSPVPGERLYRTGDRCRILEGGAIDFVGRLDRQVKVRGFRVELEEIERALSAHPGVALAAVKVLDNHDGNKSLSAYVVPTPQAVAPDEPSDALISASRVREWLQIYESVIYRSLSQRSIAAPDPSFNFTGWKSSYTGEYLSAAEMEEQVQQTVERILENQPRSVLEIGCGSGMLLFKIAPFVDRYEATDFSRAAIDYVSAHLLETRIAGKVQLHHEAANELSVAGGFDVVILNSIVQHFPSAHYLATVLKQAIALVNDGGRIFLGDLRSLPLANLFHLSLSLHKATDSEPVSMLTRFAAQGVIDEQELLLDPRFFESAGLPRLTGVRTFLKRGAHHNELTRFRYDAILEVGSAANRPAAETIDFEDSSAAVEAIASQFHGLPVQILHVPNKRLALERAAQNLIQDETALRSVSELRRTASVTAFEAPGVDPEQLWKLESELPVRVEIRPSPDRVDGSFDVLLAPRNAVPFGFTDTLPLEGPALYANDPLLPLRKLRLSRQVREHLSSALPGYMLPSFLTVQDALPLNANGKIDYTKLPLPPALVMRSANQGRELNVTQSQLAGMWEIVLNTSGIGLADHFFDCGGDSLKAVHLSSLSKSVFPVPLTPAVVFDRPTLAAMARWIDEQSAASASRQSQTAESRGARRRAFARSAR